MRILFLAPTYIDLYLPIKKNLEQRGNEVIFIEDKTPCFYPYYRRNRLKNCIYNIIHIFRNLDKKYKEYWDEIINENQLFKNHFDLFFCINGTSLHSYFINKIVEHNPNIYKTLYLWDTNRYYNFENNLAYFDKVYTFDKSDAKTLGIGYLPFYYIENNNTAIKKYDAFCIGSLHDNRLEILDLISKQMDSMNLSYIFKVIVIPIEKNIKNKIKYYLCLLFENKSKRKEMKYRMGLTHHKLISNTFVSIPEFNKLMNQSKVIIDTDRESQVGLTPRLVWALANGQTIITTNTNIELNEYCPKDKIWLIDRKNPIISLEMFQIKENNVKQNSKITNLEINSWILHFLP